MEKWRNQLPDSPVSRFSDSLLIFTTAYYIYRREVFMPKIKTNKGAAKRFRITATGKVKMAKAGRRHLLLSNSAKKSRAMRQAVYAGKANIESIKKLLPYG